MPATPITFMGMASMPGTTGSGVMPNRVEIRHTEKVTGSTCSVDSRKGQDCDFAIRTMDNNAAAVVAMHTEQIQESLSYWFDGALAGIRKALPRFHISKRWSAIHLYLKRGSLGIRLVVPRPPANGIFTA